MKKKFAPVCLILFVAVSSFAVYSQDKSLLKLADEYSLALKKYQKQKARKSVESVMRKGKALDDKIYDIEDLSEADYALLKKKMKGFVLNREEVLYIEPDSNFFLKLAKTNGTKADIAFFTVMREIKPGNVWTAYYGWQTDVTGCTKYGNGVLTKLYGKATQFKKAYPKAYVSDIDKEIEEIAYKFNEGNCACGDRKGVEREFRLFIKTFPKDKNTPIVRKRLANLSQNKEFEFYCHTG